jgi:hypothetical protein
MTRAAAISDLPVSIRRPLARFGRRWFLVRLVRVAVVALAVHGLLVLVAAHVDRILFLDPPARLALSAAAIGIPVAVFVAMTAVLWARRPGRRQLAYLFEKASGIDLAEAVVTAEALATAGADAATAGAAEGAAASGVREELLAELVATAEGMATRAAPRAAARDRWLRPAVLAAAAVAAIGGLLAAWPAYQFPLMLARVYQPWRDLPKPSFMRIKVIPDAIEIGRGDELVVQAEIAGEPPWIVERLLGLAGVDMRRCLIEMDGERPAEMTRVHRRLFLATRGDVAEPTGFRIRCGDARTARHPVDVVVQPAVESLTVAITPPAYTGRPPSETSLPKGPLAVLVGTKLSVTFRADQELREATVLAADRTPLPGVEWDAASRTGRFSVEVDDSRELTIDLVNARGFRSVRPTVLAIEAVVDQTPTVRLDAPAAESEQVPAALVPLRAEIEDDLAIESAAVVWQLNPQLDPEAPLEEIAVPVAEKGQTRLAVDLPIDLDPTGAVPGDEIVAFLRVRDSAGNDGESAPFTIRVVSFTRGENERQRLAALRWLAAASPAVQQAGDAPLGDDVRKPLDADAKRLGVAFDVEPSRAGLLGLLEREIYMTEGSRAKQDAIALDGLLSAGRPVKGEAIAALAARRRLENLVVRLFGMRGEAGRIRESLAAERKDDRPAKPGQKPAAKPGRGGTTEATTDPLKRRTTLALRTLEEIGGDLLELVRAVPATGLDAAAITDAQARLNEAGYRMTRGSARKRIDACGQLSTEIDALVAAIGPAVEPLRRLEDEARNAVAADLAATLGDLRAADDPRAREWFRRRLHLLELDPFTPGADAIDALAHAVAANQPAVPPAEAGAERGWWAWLAGQWEQKSLAAVGGLADDERTMLSGWLAGRLPPAPPGAFAAAVAAVGAAAPPLAELAEPRQVAEAIAASVDRTIAGAAADPVARAAAVAEWDRGVDLAIMGIATRGRVVRLATEGRTADDVLLLRLRDAFLRYRQNTRLAGGDSDAAADAWQRPLVGLKGAVAKLLAQYDAGELADTEAVGRDRFLAGALQSRLLWDAARGAADGGRRLAAAWPEGRQLVLADGLAKLRTAAAAIEAADAVLATASPQAGEWQRRRDEAAAGCDAFAAQAAGAAELEPVIREVRAKLAAVDRVTAWDDAAVRARRLALGEVRSAVAALERRAAAVAERADADPGGFEGGPEAIWSDDSRRQALAGRRLVVDEWLAARRAAMAGVLAESPDAAAVPWAAFAVRLGLSELGGAARGGQRQQQRETKGDPLVGWLRREIDAARKALRSNPSQGVYQKATLEYLDSVGDLLRY